MSKTKELVELINRHPEHELIFMYPYEGCYDHPYTLGHPSKTLVDEYWIDDERVWLKYEDEDEIFDHYADNIFDDLYPHESYANDEQTKIINQETKEYIRSRDWKKCICVFISY